MNKRTKKAAKRLIAVLLCLLCLLGAMPLAAIATETEETQPATIAETTAVTEATTLPTETNPAGTESGEAAVTEPPETTAPAATEAAPLPTETEPAGTEPGETQASEPADAEKKEQSLYEKLLTAESCQAMQAILDDAPLADVEALTDDELTILIDHVDSLPDDGYKEDLLLDLYHLRDGEAQSLATYNATATIQQGSSGTAQFSNTTYWWGNETWTVTPADAGINVSAEGYTDKVTVEVGSSVTAGSYILSCTKRTLSNNSNTYTINLNVTASSSGGSGSTDADFTITNYMENTQVAYIDFKPKQSTSYTLTEIANGQTVYGSGSNGDGVLVFFIKPRDGYLLTEFVNAAGSKCDLYSTTVTASDSSIQYFRNNSTEAQKIIAAASAQGYLGYYGFTYSGTNYSAASYSTKAERPQMKVTAVADKTTGVKPGDTVTYTVTITPGHTTAGNDKVTGVNITSMTINGEEVSYTTLVANNNGTYTTTVTRTVTEEDWASGDVTLTVDASVGYSYEITVKDRNNTESKIPTTATVPNSAEVSVPVAPKNGVRYVVTHEPSEKTPPEITKTVPIDTGSYFEGDTIDVNTTYGSATHAEGEPANVVDDPTNGGTWTFNGWYKDEGLTQKANATETKTGDGATIFYGEWTFEEYPTVTLTIKKLVDGNMLSHNDAFKFTVTVNGEAQEPFNLKHEESKEITVNKGDTITIQEEAGNYITTVDVGTLENGQVTIADIAEDTTITFTNTHNVTIDTGISLETLPYILILAVVAVGAVVMIRKRKVRDED